MNRLHRIPLCGLWLSKQLRAPSVQRHIVAPRFINTTPRCLHYIKDPSRGEDHAKPLDPANLTDREASAKAERGKQAALQDLGHGNAAHPNMMHEDASSPKHIDNLQLPESEGSDEPMKGSLHHLQIHRNVY